MYSAECKNVMKCSNLTSVSVRHTYVFLLDTQQEHVPSTVVLEDTYWV